MAKTRSCTLREAGLPEKITKPKESRTMRSGRVRKEATAKTQRRNFTEKRRLRAKAYLETVSHNPEVYGRFKSKSWMKGLLAAIDEPEIVELYNVEEWVTKQPGFFSYPVSDVKKFKWYDAVDNLSSKKCRKPKMPVTVPVSPVPLPLKSKEETDDGQCNSCDNLSIFMRKHLGPSYCEEWVEKTTKYQFQCFPTDSGIDSMGTQTSPTTEEVMYIPMEDNQTTRVNLNVNTGPDVIIDEPIDIEDAGDNVNVKEQQRQQPEVAVEVEVENQDLEEQTQQSCVTIRTPFVCPQTFIINSNDFIQFAKAAGTSGNIVQPESRDFYLLNRMQPITLVEDHKVKKVQDNLLKYNNVLSAYDNFIFEFEKWHGFTVEPRNYQISQMFTELRSKLEGMQEELIQYLLR